MLSIKLMSLMGICVCRCAWGRKVKRGGESPPPPLSFCGINGYPSADRVVQFIPAAAVGSHLLS